MVISPRLRTLLVIATTAVVFLILSTQVSLPEALRVLGSARPDLLIAATLLTFLFPVFTSLRWKIILELLGYRISYGLSLRLILASWPVGSITPSKSGDLIRAYYLKDKIPAAVTLGSVLAERAVDVLTLLAFSAAGAAVFRWMEVLWLSTGLFILGVAILILLVLKGDRLPVPTKFQSKIGDMLRAFRVLARDPRSLLLVVFYTAVKWLLSVVQTWICFHALGHPVSLALVSGALPLAVFVGLIPVTISGMGTRDSALVFLCRGHAPAEVTLAVGLLYTLFGYWLLSVVGLPFLRKALPEGTKALEERPASGESVKK
jgi:uncharacterized membrane protein YbhN (UPF0104 family)